MFSAIHMGGKCKKLHSVLTEIIATKQNQAASQFLVTTKNQWGDLDGAILVRNVEDAHEKIVLDDKHAST